MLNRHAVARRIFVCLMSGLCVSVLVAWIFAATYTNPAQWNPDEIAPPKSWLGNTPGWPPPESALVTGSSGFTSIGLWNGIDKLASTRRNDPSVTCYYLDVRESGWPFRCLRSQRGTVQVMRTITPLKTNVLYDGLAIPPWLARDGLVERTLPLYPMWAGLGADCVLYAAATLAFLRGVGAVRAARRRRSGRCANCGYQVETLGACPECGAPVAPAVPRKAAGT